MSRPVISEPSARDKILEAAEMLFAEEGLHGVSMRQIAVAAKVPIGLIGYHFGSKDGLYRAVFERRSPTVVEQRLAGLRLAEDEPDAGRRLELIVKALVLPMVRLRTIDAQARFGRLMAREASDPNAFARGIIPEIFDPVAQEVVAALAGALPERSRTQIYWGYQFMLGALIFLMADTGRIERLSDGRCNSHDAEAIARYLVPFLVAALRHGLAATPAGDGPRLAHEAGLENRRRSKQESAHEARHLPRTKRRVARGRARR
jgi:AcrR family transcriptional regulator